MNNTLLIDEVSKEHVQAEIVENAETVHKRILDNLKVVNNALYQVGLDLKYFRDNNLYRQMGYISFISYCNSELNMFDIKIRQVYRYISIVENLSNDFVSSTTQLGVQKLYCLSSLTESERTELIESTDLENTSVKEVEKKTKEIKQNREVKQSTEINEDLSTSNVVTPAPIPKFDNTFINFKEFCKNVRYSGYRGRHLNDSDFWRYNGQVVKHNLLDYYSYFIKTINNLFKTNIDISDYELLSRQISDLIEVSNRLNTTLFDVKDVLEFEMDKQKRPYLYESDDKNE